MNISDNITRLAQKIATDKATIENLAVDLDKDTGNTTITAQIDQLTAQVEKDSGALATFQNIERMQAKLALPVAPTIVPSFRKEQFTPEHLWRAAVVQVDAHYTGRSIDEVAKARFPDSSLTRDLCLLSLNRSLGGRRGFGVLSDDLLTRAAQNPAMTNVPGYAQELVHQTFAAWMDALQGTSAVAKVAFRRGSFEAGSPIVVPYRAAKSAFPDNLEAAFRAEGAPIRVGRLATTSKTLYPYSMAVIGHTTRELVARSTPQILDILRQAILDDTASILDGLVFGAGAAVTGVRPAGLTNGIDPADTRVATATPTLADIDSDLNSMIKQLTAVRMLGGPGTSWVMNTANALALSGQRFAMGNPAFPDASAAGGSLKGYPIASSSFFPLDQVLLVDGSAIFMAGGAPEFTMSSEATLHEENTTPVSIDAATSNVRSLFQTNSEALRMIQEISWDDLRVGAVQQLTAVDW